MLAVFGTRPPRCPGDLFGSLCTANTMIHLCAPRRPPPLRRCKHQMPCFTAEPRFSPRPYTLPPPRWLWCVCVCIRGQGPWVVSRSASRRTLWTRSRLGCRRRGWGRPGPAELGPSSASPRRSVRTARWPSTGEPAASASRFAVLEDKDLSANNPGF